jgi:hypothetical protein
MAAVSTGAAGAEREAGSEREARAALGAVEPAAELLALGAVAAAMAVPMTGFVAGVLRAAP